MTATLINQPIQERILNTIDIWKMDKEEVQKLEKQLSIAKNKVIKSAQDVVYIQRMAQISNFESNITQWQQDIYNGFVDSHENEWTESYHLQVPTLKFKIVITKKRNLKKFKHIVRVEGEKLYISENFDEVNNPTTSSDYFKDKYQDEELEKKFANLEDARAFVQVWKDRIEGDYAEELQEHRDLYQEFKNAGLMYDPERAKKMRFEQRRGEPLTVLQQFSIFNKNEIQ